MRYLLVLLTLCLTAADVFGWSLSLAPGLSVKNGMVYLALLALAARFIVRGGARIELPRIHLLFAVFLAYATLTWLTAAFLIQYKTFDLTDSAISLKQLFDNAIVFLLFLYGAQTLRDAEFLLKCMLLLVAAANAIAIGNVAGILNIGQTIVGTDGNLTGRVYGAFGHANETAALIVCLLPAYFAAAFSARRGAAVLWISAAAISGALLFLTGSRGALVGLGFATILGSYLCRNLIEWRRAAVFVLILLAIAVPLLIFASLQSGGVLLHRLTEMIVNPGAEDDRTAIWFPVFDRMISSPLALMTGFGWGAYDAMGFPYLTHNHYLALWFELGVIGLASFLMMIREMVLISVRAARSASDETARYLIAFVYGIIALASAIFFTQLFHPWLYIWAYAGLTMRMAAIVAQKAPAKARREDRGAVAIGTRPLAGAAAVGRRAADSPGLSSFELSRRPRS